MYAIFGLIYAFGSEPLGKLSDKIGRRRILIIGYMLFVLVCIGFATQHTTLGIGILFGLYGVVFAMTEPVQKAMISDLSGRQKGTAMGYFHFIRGLTVIMGGLIAGIIWNVNNLYMFYYLAFVGAMALVALYGTKKTIRRILLSGEEITLAARETWNKYYK